MIVPKAVDFAGHKMQYLFRINEERYFLIVEKVEPLTEYEWESTRNLRKFEWKELAFAAATAYHLYQWYRDNQYCGRCGEKLEHDHREDAAMQRLRKYDLPKDRTGSHRGRYQRKQNTAYKV